MKLILTSIFMTIYSYSYCQDSLNIELQSRIYKIYLLDQECREKLRKFKNNELDTANISISQIENNITLTDSMNYYELKSIISEFGYPGYRLVGEDFSNSFWNIVQHQDNNIEFQKDVMDKMKMEVDKQNASSTYFAYLTDRVKINSGEKQIYGTQLQLNSTATSYEVKATIDVENLNVRRKEMNLIPSEEYIQIMNSKYYGTLKKE
jgi:hypothetical protein